MIADCYSTDLYCDAPQNAIPFEEWPSYHFNWSHTQYTGRNRSETIRKAKKEGWVFHRDGTHTCPDCAAKIKESPHV